MSCFSAFVHSIVQNAVHLSQHYVVSRAHIELLQLYGEFLIQRLVCLGGCDGILRFLSHFRHRLYGTVDAAVGIFCGILYFADSFSELFLNFPIRLLYLLRYLDLNLCIADDSEEVEHGIYAVDGTIKLQQRLSVITSNSLQLFPHVGFHLAQIAQGVVHKHRHLLFCNSQLVTQLLLKTLHSNSHCGLCLRNEVFQIVNLILEHHLGILEQCYDNMVEQSMKRLQLEHFLTVHRTVHLNTSDLNVLQVLIEAEDVLCHTSRIKQECCRAFFIEPFIAGIIV